ncbi:4-vinyl protochlorophyllide reductase (Bacteriochlorophyll synthase 23 kDa chain) (4-vinyl reductase) [Bradyrhizobium sp. ORS 278]|uniref:bacteriochlorophyll 4-vinyl reductase n=1 Tax=Bradyrhizobium sp. (strain ORS 278) TaxID=114615 RepID=UPI0001507607|nr:bacteriochlorophyll 4-vinyl reductase [Bradyrhizobium sp. ORS 278]CAL75531.1 4-vinyl protochlorophyllide reductase (Bacteriochlorophyll synthase 23 kDa chain) (4-vinyl reductase) [Bradyrhizobium sp. ORS 278]
MHGTRAQHAPLSRAAAASDHAAGRIGPNAIIQTAEALRLLLGEDIARRVFAAARLDAYLSAPPADMVDEAEVIRLHLALRRTLDDDTARAVATRAGHLTGAYLLAHRIPSAAQRLLRLLPARLAARALSRAIAAHAWTFAGTGTFTARPGRPTIYEISHCPLCRGQNGDHAICDFYAATFETLFARLVHPNARAREIGCEATGASACRFEIDW